MATTTHAVRDMADLEALGLYTLTGQTVRVQGALAAWHEEIPAFEAEVVSTWFSFDRVTDVEVQHPTRGRIPVNIERVIALV